MSEVSKTGLNLNTDRVSAGSRRVLTLPTPKKGVSASFKREVFNDTSSAFVEVSGNRYFFNAPRGTYVDVFV